MAIEQSYFLESGACVKCGYIEGRILSETSTIRGKVYQQFKRRHDEFNVMMNNTTKREICTNGKFKLILDVLYTMNVDDININQVTK